MGQFKPMVKMMTTEPSVILKLKKGGMMGGGAMHAYKTGGVVKAYKDGGHAAMTCKDVGGFISKKKLSSC